MPWKNVLPMEEKERFVNLMETSAFSPIGTKGFHVPLKFGRIEMK